MYVCMGCVQQSEAASLHTGGAPALHAVGLLRDRVAAGCGQGRRAQPCGVVVLAAALRAVLAASDSALPRLPLVLPRQGKLEAIAFLQRAVRHIQWVAVCSGGQPLRGYSLHADPVSAGAGHSRCRGRCRCR
jgi:hypothetical protein